MDGDELVQHMIKFRDFVNTVMNQYDPYNTEGFLKYVTSNVLRNVDNDFV